MDSEASSSLFSFGVISDIQYADIDDRYNVVQACTRHYRNALVLLRESIQYWTAGLCAARPDFVVQLGDVIDGFNSEEGKSKSLCCLQTVLREFDKLPCTVHHVFGNHEFYNFTRAELMKSKLFSGGDFETTTRDSKCQCFPDIFAPNGLRTETTPRPAAYYHFSPYEGFRCIVLDTNDISVIAHGKSCPIHWESLCLLRSVNKNEDLDSPFGLTGLERRFLKYSGGIGESQLKWLEGVLREASCAKEKVLVFGHNPIYPIEAHHISLLWNYKEVLDLLRALSPCVVAVFAGHAHCHAHALDKKSGIHFLTLPGIIEVPPGSNGFGTVSVHPDKLVLHGVGEVMCVEMPFP